MNDKLWGSIIAMIYANFDKINDLVAKGKYGMAAHYDSKNVALIEVLEMDSPKTFKLAKKDASVKSRVEAIKKSRSK